MRNNEPEINKYQIVIRMILNKANKYANKVTR